MLYKDAFRSIAKLVWDIERKRTREKDEKSEGKIEGGRQRGERERGGEGERGGERERRRRKRSRRGREGWWEGGGKE